MAAADAFRSPVFRNAGILTVILLAQAGLYHGAVRYEVTPVIAPLEGFPRQVAGWRTVRDFPIDNETQEILRADDTVSRLYVSGSGVSASLFIAFFRSQRSGQTPHSPRNCLPGSGYEPLDAGFLDVEVPGVSGPLRINRYLVVRGEERNLVLYWYQSRGRVVAGEFAARFWLIADSIRYRRSDTALVRIVVPVPGGDDTGALRAGVRFVQAFFPPLLAALAPIG